MTGRARPRPPAFVGREAQLRALGRARRDCPEKGLVRCVVTGEPGAGRTALLGAFARAARAEGSTTVGLVGRRRDRHVPGALVEELVLALADALPAGSEPQTRLRSVQERLGAEDFCSAVPGPGRGPALWPTVLSAVTVLAARAPLVLTVDDVCRAGPGALAALQLVLETCAHLPVVVVVSVRPGEPAEAPPELAELLLDARQLALDGLSERETALLMRALLPRVPTAGLVGACHRLTAGNPLLICELAGWVRDGLRAARGPVVPESAVLPEVAELVRGRVARIDADAGRVAEAIAVAAGRGGADTSLVAHLSGIGLSRTLNALDLLVRMRLVADEDSLRLRHPLLAQSLLGAMTLMARNAAHLTIAAYLHERGAPAEWIADHLIASTVPPGGAWPVGALLRAARSAEDATALRYLELAVRTAAGEEHRVAMLELAAARVRADPAAGLGAAVDMLARATDHVTRARLLGHIGRALDGAGLPEAAQRVPDQVAALVDGTPLHGWPHLHRCLTHFYESPPADTAKIIEDLPGRPPSAGRDGVPRTHAAATAIGAFCRFLVDDDPRAAVRRARWALGRSLDELGLHPLALPSALTVLGESGHHDEAAAHVRRLDGFAQGWPSASRAMLLLVEARIALAAGEVPTARGRLAAALERTAGYGAAASDPVLVCTVGLLAGVLLSLDEGAEAEALLRRHGYLGELPPGWHYQDLLLARARLRAAGSDLVGAGRDMAELLERGRDAGLRATGTVSWRMHGVALLDQVGRTEEARQLARQQVRFAGSTGSAGERGRALRVLGRVEGGTAGEHLLNEAVSLLENTQDTYDLAHALGDLGCLLIRLDRPDEALAVLTRAVRLADRCEARALSGQLGQQLLAADERAPQHVSLRGILALTRRERQILVDAMRGLTNKRIATMRQITRRTVELHLSSAYRKLRIDGRGDFPLVFCNPGLWTLLTDGALAARRHPAAPRPAVTGARGRASAGSPQSFGLGP
ncbi:AAA family ATPase [Streptomyces sp. MP131-18]|uniref:AAA family ATPase n=1 Tax=Streptomyces sp. MP131-18 TaxID=1857892 RepID=UPI00097C6D41|nr:AAA family ATPase [Streptomyces sp. MP131-18]ONK10271.1 transcriptional regulator NarL [Streptomyces sp. MP131-18]